MNVAVVGARVRAWGGPAVMRVTVISRKGGVGKTVTAVHLAAFLSDLSGGEKTLLVDTDPSRNALRWSSRGNFPFRVVGEERAAEEMPTAEHVVVDVKGSPDADQIEGAAARSDVLIIPAMPNALSLDTLMQTVGDISEVGREEYYRVLLTAVPPWPYRRGKRAREALLRIGVPMFEAEVGRLEAFETATEEGILVGDVGDRRADRGWRCYRDVGEELVSWVSSLRTRDLRAANG